MINKNSEMQTVPIKLTKRIIKEMEELIEEGWYANRSELIRDAVLKIIKKLKIAKLKSIIKEDIKWGLYSK
jgi:Arc/MetJ-type ribon-helix-helix transcriptional regulator